MRARSLRAQGRALSEPRSPLANSEGRMPGVKKGDSLARRASESTALEGEEESKMDSRLRGNDDV